MPLLWQYLKNFKKLLALTLLLAALNQVFSLLDPLLFRLLIDNYASKATSMEPGIFLKGVGLLIFASMLTAFLSRLAKNFQDFYVNIVTLKLGARMYNHSVAHAFSLPFFVFEDQRSGELLDKLHTARRDAMRLVTQSINVLFLSAVGMIFVIVYSFFTHWSVGLTFVLMIPILGYATFRISRKIKYAQADIVRETTALTGTATETLRNVELVKSLGLEKQETARLNSVVDKVLSLELKKVKLVRRYSFLQGTMINTLRSGLLFLMFYLILQGELTLGAFFSLMFYSFMIFNPLGEFGNLAATYQEAKASMAQMDEILKLEKEPKPDHPIAINRIENIAFRKVSFRYPSSQDDALVETDFSVPSGKTIALVGPSGSGKTSIIKLLVGLYSPSAGQVEVNGISLADTDKEQLRSLIGFVSQDTQLFAGTIRDNLLFVKPDATDADCIKALEGASASRIIERGEQGLDTKIGEGGLKLSGGEKQRLSIARALLRDPGLLIFDEATSSLDSLTELEITETIKNIRHIKPDLITVLVAHRLSTIIHADTIYVLEKGRIVESGTHEELVKKPTLYSALWRQQIASRK